MAAWSEKNEPTGVNVMLSPSAGESQVWKVIGEKWEGPHNSAPSVLKALKIKAPLRSQVEMNIRAPYSSGIY